MLLLVVVCCCWWLEQFCVRFGGDAVNVVRCSLLASVLNGVCCVLLYGVRRSLFVVS